MSTTPDTDQKVLLQTLELKDQRVVDIGCGRGGLVRFLRANGARPTGIECAPQQIAAARAADPDHADDYHDGVAEDLPLPDGAADIAIFLYSLHHVAPENMGRALAETYRILVPDGHAYIAEPIAAGPSHELDRLIDDETEVRAAAQRALDRATAIGFHREAAFDYASSYIYRDFQAYADMMTGIDPTRQACLDEVGPQAEAVFHRVGKAVDGGFEFEQSIRVTVLRKE